ncbi:hypothetical protein KR222_007544, partial [Zaprionus bogoriensis]
AVAAAPPPAEPIYGTMIPNRIFVGGISHDTTESDLMVVFSAYGRVRSTKIIVDQDGLNKGYGFVTFETEGEAQRLQTIGRCVILRNRRLNIAPAFKKPPIRPKLPPMVDNNGTVYFATQAQPHPPPPSGAIGNIPIGQFGAASTYPQGGAVNEFAGTAAVPAIYQQTPAGLQYQPVYQYYSVPVNVPAVWHQNFYQD